MVDLVAAVAVADRGTAAEVGSLLLHDLVAELVLVEAAQAEAAQEVEQVQVRVLVELVLEPALAALVASVSELVALACRDWARAELESVVVPAFVPVQPLLAVRHWVLMEPPSARTVATSGTSILD